MGSSHWGSSTFSTINSLWLRMVRSRRGPSLSYQATAYHREQCIQWAHLSGGPLSIESGALNGLIYMVRIVGLNRGGDVLSAIKLHLVRPDLQWDRADRERYIKWAHLSRGHVSIKSGALNGLISLEELYLCWVRLHWVKDILSDIKPFLVIPGIQWDWADRKCGIEWTHLTGVALPIVQSTDCDSSEKKYYRVCQGLSSITDNIPAEAQEVEIKGNNISTVPTDAFSQLSHCTSLRLDYNEIKRIESGTFNGLI